MSSKRGRKRNDNLPPNRARDVQRAFRARRAAHLLALEQRVAELELENDCFRQALDLAPSNRPPLGKGPTGKDKPKSYDGQSGSAEFHSSRESSFAESPPSRTSSLSPSAMAVAISSRPIHIMEDATWNDTVLVNQHQPSDVPPSAESSYNVAPMSAPSPLKPLQYPLYGSLPSSSRSSLSNSMYMNNSASYSHPSPDRSLGSTYSDQSFSMRGNIRDDNLSRTHFSYQPSPFQTHDSHMHSQSPPPNVTEHTHPHHDVQRQSPLPHRRCLTEPQAFSIGQGFPRLPNPAHAPHTRQLDFSRQSGNIDHSLPFPPRSVYGPDGRLNSLS